VGGGKSRGWYENSPNKNYLIKYPKDDIIKSRKEKRGKQK
jgi:hypothetical protein